MPQQINLCTPILLTQKRYFSAHTMVIALGVFLLLGGILAGVWVWNLDKSTQSFRQSTLAQSRDLEALKAAIERSKASAAPVDPALLAQLQTRRNSLAQREKLREALKEGMFRPGWGHSDRLTWVARSIPAPVWVTEVKMDGTRFEVTGYTLEPSALNEWVDQLAVSPLMQGLKLSTVRVESATLSKTATVGAPTPVTSNSVAAARPVWSFNLVSMEPAPQAALAAASAPGSKP
ncbi:MAG: PilN domain-containing protein [Rhodoferax sp.]